jgi:hypothetical protein
MGDGRYGSPEPSNVLLPEASQRLNLVEVERPAAGELGDGARSAEMAGATRVPASKQPVARSK